MALLIRRLSPDWNFELPWPLRRKSSAKVCLAGGASTNKSSSSVCEASSCASTLAVQERAAFSADVDNHGKFDAAKLGLVAYCMGPFIDKPIVRHVSPDVASSALAVGCSNDLSLVQNNVLFQDCSVADHSASISFDPTEGGTSGGGGGRGSFVLECADPRGVVISNTITVNTTTIPIPREGEGKSEGSTTTTKPTTAAAATTTSATDVRRNFIHVKAGERCPVPLCSAVRFGKHSWISFMPFCPTALALAGTYNGDQEISTVLSKHTTTIGSEPHLADVFVPAAEVAKVHCKVGKFYCNYKMRLVHRPLSSFYYARVRLLFGLLFDGCIILHSLLFAAPFATYN